MTPQINLVPKTDLQLTQLDSLEFSSDSEDMCGKDLEL